MLLKLTQNCKFSVYIKDFYFEDMKSLQFWDMKRKFKCSNNKLSQWSIIFSIDLNLKFKNNYFNFIDN